MLVVDAIRQAIEESGDSPEELDNLEILINQLHDLEGYNGKTDIPEPEDFEPDVY